MAENCGYCGRYMALVDYGAEFGSEWVCSQQAKHIADDPEHWSVYGDDGWQPAPRSDVAAECPEWLCPDLSTEDRRDGKTCPDHPCTCGPESDDIG